MSSFMFYPADEFNGLSPGDVVYVEPSDDKPQVWRAVPGKQPTDISRDVTQVEYDGERFTITGHKRKGMVRTVDSQGKPHEWQAKGKVSEGGEDGFQGIVEG